MTKPRLVAAVGFSLLLALGASPANTATTSSAATTAGATSKASTTHTGRRGATPSKPPTPVVDPEARAALLRMGDYLSTLTNFEVKTETTRDIVTYDGQRIQLDGDADYKVRRPNGFVIDVHSNDRNRTYYYDGKQFTVFAPALGFYATAPAPATIIQTLDRLYDRFGIALPLEDLFRWNDPNLHRSESLVSGYKVGAATIDGVLTDQYAFREGDIDWQIWIQHDGQPLPRKLVIVDRTDPANPAYSARLTWDVSPTLNAEDFTFKPGPDAKLIRLTAVGQ